MLVHAQGENLREGSKLMNQPLSQEVQITQAAGLGRAMRKPREERHCFSGWLAFFKSKGAPCRTCSRLSASVYFPSSTTGVFYPG